MNGFDLEIINPLNFPGWDDLLLSQREYSFFHSSHWARVLHESYGYRPLYFMLTDQGRLSALVPLMEVESVLTGKRGVSLPFTDYCEPIFSGKSDFQQVMSHVIRYGKKAGWKYIELRSGNGFAPEVPISSYYFGHTLDLSQGERQIYSRLRESTKRNIRKALREGVDVRISTSPEAMAGFCRLNCLTRREHGLPPQPDRFFRNVHDHIVAKNLGFVALASWNGKTIAGAVFFHSREKAVYKYGASDKAYHHLRANNLVMWSAIQSCVQNGYKIFCFGRTEPENTGLRQFKSGWGAEEKILKYYTYDIGNMAFAANERRTGRYHYGIFKRMPMPLLKIAGRVLYRHVG